MKNRIRWWIKITLAILLVLIILGSYFFLYDPQYSGLVEHKEKTLIIAHRGFGNYAPDNALVSAKIALENDMEGIDVDGQMAKDKELVIFHDPRVDRLTNGTGYTKDLTLEELQSLDLGVKFNESFKGEKVHTFEEFLQTINGTAIYMVELKESSVKSGGSAETAVEIVQKYNAHDYVYLSSFNPFVLYRIKKIDKNVKTVFIFMDTNWNEEILKEVHPTDLKGIPFFLRKEIFRRAIRKMVNPDLLSINKEVNEYTVNNLLEKGWPVFVWTPDTEEEINKTLSKEPYGIITNEPLMGKMLRDEYGLFKKR